MGLFFPGGGVCCLLCSCCCQVGQTADLPSWQWGRLNESKPIERSYYLRPAWLYDLCSNWDFSKLWNLCFMRQNVQHFDCMELLFGKYVKLKLYCIHKKTWSGVYLPGSLCSLWFQSRAPAPAGRCRRSPDPGARPCWRSSSAAHIYRSRWLSPLRRSSPGTGTLLSTRPESRATRGNTPRWHSRPQWPTAELQSQRQTSANFLPTFSTRCDSPRPAWCAGWWSSLGRCGTGRRGGRNDGATNHLSHLLEGFCA